MIKRASHIVFPLLLLVSFCTVFRTSVPAKQSAVNQASEHRINPCDEDVPTNSEDRDPADNKADQEDDALVFEKLKMRQPGALVEQIIFMPAHPFREHHLEIITPPPRS